MKAQVTGQHMHSLARKFEGSHSLTRNRAAYLIRAARSRGRSLGRENIYKLWERGCNRKQALGSEYHIVDANYHITIQPN